LIREARVNRMSRGRKKKTTRAKTAIPHASTAGSQSQRRFDAEKETGATAAPLQRNLPDPVAPPPSSIFQPKVWLWALFLVAATVLSYQQAWHAGYIWDDDEYVTKNELLTASDGLKRIWFSLDSPSQYFPLVYTTFRLEYALWGLHPAGYHWVNIVLHAANALLVWRLLSRLHVPGAGLAAGFFALHPVHVESVAWITERKNVLMGLFFLLALLSWNTFVEERSRARWKPYALALVLYALALFSKTTACTIPAALLLILWLKRKPLNWSRAAQIAPFVVLGIAMGLVSVWWERHHQGTQGELFAIGLPERVLIASRAIWFYLGKLFWPADLAFSYARWSVAAGDPLDYFWLLATAGACVAIFFARRRVGRGIEVALLFFVTTLSPMLGFIMLYTFRYSFVADHYQYLASIGPLALAAAGITTGFRFLKEKPRFLDAAVCGALLVSLGVLTWRQCRIYADEETLWQATIATNPDSWMAYNNLGIKRRQAGRLDEAITHYKKALEINPRYAEAHFNLGNAFVHVGQPKEAAAQYNQALQLHPRYPAAHANLGAALLEMGRVDEAVAHLREAIAIDPRNAAARGQLGGALARLGRVEEAIVEFQSVLQLEPGSAVAENNLGNILLQSGRLEEAMSHLRQAVQIEETNPEAHYNLGNVFLRLQRHEEAVTSYSRAVELRPGYARARNNLANAYVQVGRLEEAIRQYEQALQTDPNYAAAHHNLGRALARVGRAPEAQAHLQRAEELDAQQGRGQSRP